MPAVPATNMDTDIIVTDALGRILRLPYEHFHISWWMVRARMNVAFQGCPGEASTKYNSYTMQSSPEVYNEFHAGIWTRVPPGARLSMVVQVEGGDHSLTECPSCGLDFGGNLLRDSTG